jgi:hypothetical protein
MRALIFGLLYLVAACTSVGTDNRLYTGVYSEGMETMTFHADGEAQAWSVTGPAVGALQNAAPARQNPWDGFRIRAIVKGELSQPGRYGHLGMYQREITITEVVLAPAPERGP